MLEALQVAEAILPMPRPALPPYNGYGTLDDSRQNCVALVPKPPKKVCLHVARMYTYSRAANRTKHCQPCTLDTLQSTVL
jgi:hypothetical protein